ncbi:MAG TPA: GTP-binding protein [Gemmataceae bacterium]|nr:GTP-binding protein [Gemmataceae bacterium]
MREATSGVPTNLVTGFLGVGKTTALLDLLRTRPPGSRWAVIVNEYGEVGIDGALLSDVGGVEIQEVAGGCICCTSAVEFNYTLAQVLEQVKPERLLIETTGVGHPARILEDLRKPAFARFVDLRATVGILAPADFTCPPMFESPVFRDQIELADVLVLNKADQTTPAVRDRFLNWARDLYPPKLHAAVTDQGRLDPAWLDLGADPNRRALYPEAHHHADAEPVNLVLPTPGRPVHKESRGPGGRACGWVFAPTDVFDEDRLLAFLSADAGVLRLKGVFHTTGGWTSVNRSGRETVAGPSGYRRDSRVEVFAQQVDGGWAGYEAGLVACLTPPAAPPSRRAPADGPG